MSYWTTNFWTSNYWTANYWSSGAVTITAAVSGTIVGAVEADVVSTGGTLIITLTNDTWLAAGTGPIGTTAQSQALIDGITSAQVEAGGWNTTIRDVLVPATHLVRTSNTVATLTVPATVGYDITASETITPTIPASVLTTSGSPVVGSTFQVLSDESQSTTWVQEHIVRRRGQPKRRGRTILVKQ